jgi:cytochrome c556
MKKILLILVMLLGFSACVRPSKELNPPSIHMIKSKKLKILMQQLDNVIYERQMSELDRDHRRRRYVKSMAISLKKLSDELKLIEPIDANVSERNYYKEYAQLLDVEVDALDSLAKENTFEYLPNRLNSINNICNSCHTQFNVAPRK